MNSKLIPLFALILLANMALTCALVVDADYITIYPGEQGKVVIEIENNENFDIEEVSIALELGGKKIFNDFGVVVEEVEALPFTIVGSSEKDVDDIREDKDESVSFTLKASIDIDPGDYNIPYTVKYVDEEDRDEILEKTGSFGLRVSAKTELDFTVESRDSPIVGKEGKVSLEIINKGLGDLKSMQVEVFPQGFELLSKSKIFIGTINAEDTDLATFDVLYKTTNPVFKAKITYKDFDNNEQVENVNLPFRVYTAEEALERGLITKSNTRLYIGVIILLIIIWFVYRKIKKNREKKRKEGR
jgi:hypothetical protein